jgi:ATP-dependent RNA helicase SUPV3L1/SUV3
MGPLPALVAGPGLSGLARGIAYQLVETLGILPRSDPAIADTLRALDPQRRAELRRLGVIFGESAVHVPALLKPAATRLKLILWSVWQELMDPPPAPGPGLVNVPVDPAMPPGYYLIVGFRPMGQRAIRIDMLERVSQIARALDEVGPFAATPEMMALMGIGEDHLFEVLENLGFQWTEAADESGAVKKMWRRKRERHQRPPRRPDAEPSARQPAPHAPGRSDQARHARPHHPSPPSHSQPATAASQSDGASAVLDGPFAVLAALRPAMEPKPKPAHPRPAKAPPSKPKRKRPAKPRVQP